MHSIPKTRACTILSIALHGLKNLTGLSSLHMYGKIKVEPANYPVQGFSLHSRYRKRYFARALNHVPKVQLKSSFCINILPNIPTLGLFFLSFLLSSRMPTFKNYHVWVFVNIYKLNPILTMHGDFCLFFIHNINF